MWHYQLGTFSTVYRAFGHLYQFRGHGRRATNHHFRLPYFPSLIEKQRGGDKEKLSFEAVLEKHTILVRQFCLSAQTKNGTLSQKFTSSSVRSSGWTRVTADPPMALYKWDGKIPLVSHCQYIKCESKSKINCNLTFFLSFVVWFHILISSADASRLQNDWNLTLLR